MICSDGGLYGLWWPWPTPQKKNLFLIVKLQKYPHFILFFPNVPPNIPSLFPFLCYMLDTTSSPSSKTRPNKPITFNPNHIVTVNSHRFSTARPPAPTTHSGTPFSLSFREYQTKTLFLFY